MWQLSSCDLFSRSLQRPLYLRSCRSQSSACCEGLGPTCQGGMAGHDAQTGKILALLAALQVESGSAPATSPWRACRPAALSVSQSRRIGFLISTSRAVAATAGALAALVGAVLRQPWPVLGEVRGSRCVCTAARQPLLPRPLRLAPDHADMLGDLSELHKPAICRQATSTAFRSRSCARIMPCL